VGSDSVQHKSAPPDLPLLVFNLLLVGGTAALILSANLFFLKDSQSTTLNENSFLTTEWRLLKEMKEQTDEILQVKDRELDELRQRYRTLLAGNNSPEGLRALEEELKRVESERQEILAHRFASTTAAGPLPAPVQSADSVLPPLAAAGSGVSADMALSGISAADSLAAGGFVGGGAGTGSAIALLLRNRVEELEEETALAEVLQAKLRADNARLGSELTTLKARLSSGKESATPGTEDKPGAEPPNSSAAALPAAGSDAAQAQERSEILRILEEQRALLDAAAPPLGLADVKTRTLLRAIVRSPAIRSEYPTLVDDLDRYFALYGATERLKGKKAAYDEAIGTVRGQGE